MRSPHDESGSRRVLVGTTNGMFEGNLSLGARLRTLDYLNRSSTRFVVLSAARSLSSRLELQGDPVHVNLKSILWVAEVEAMQRAKGAIVRPQQNRSAARFRFPDCEIVGFLHTPLQGDPLARLFQDRSPFLAVTSASIIGSDAEMAAAFLAVNCDGVFTIELMGDDDVIEDDASIFEEAGA